MQQHFKIHSISSYNFANEILERHVWDYITSNKLQGRHIEAQYLICIGVNIHDPKPHSK
jgi:hypothetical protein